MVFCITPALVAGVILLARVRTWRITLVPTRVDRAAADRTGSRIFVERSTELGDLK